LRPDVFDVVIRDDSGGIAVGEVKGGFFRHEEARNQIRSLLRADELEQARRLLAARHTAAAAVVAGVVLETALRTLCGDKSIPVRTPDGKPVALDKMNANLAKTGLYDTVIQKRVAMLVDIRNKAAHGDTAGFGGTDVKDMIMEVERFISDYLTA
jgi:hypothetical protein